MLRTFLHTLSAQTAFLKINIRQIILQCNRLKLASLHALAATYAGYGAGLLRYRSLVLVDAGHINPAVLLVLVAKFNDVSRTGPYASTTGGTLVLINLGKTCLRIHPNGSETAGGHTVATAQTAIEAPGLTTADHICNGTALHTAILIDTGTVLTTAITAYHRNFGSHGLNFATHYGGNLLHHLRLRHGTVHTLERTLPYAGLGKGGTAREAASTAVSPRQKLLNLGNPRIGLNGKLPGNQEEYHTYDQSGYTQDYHCC